MTFFTARSNLLFNAFVSANAQTLDFMETAEACELNVDTNNWPSEYMNKYEYHRASSLFDLCPRSLRFILSNICSQVAGHIGQIVCGAFMIGKRHFVQTMEFTWPRLPPCQYMVKSFKKILCTKMPRWWHLGDLYFFFFFTERSNLLRGKKFGKYRRRSQVSNTGPLVRWSISVLLLVADSKHKSPSTVFSFCLWFMLSFNVPRNHYRDLLKGLWITYTQM